MQRFDTSSIIIIEKLALPAPKEVVAAAGAGEERATAAAELAAEQDNLAQQLRDMQIAWETRCGEPRVLDSIRARVAGGKRAKTDPTGADV